MTALRVAGFTLLSIAVVGWVVALTNADVLAAANMRLALQSSRVTLGQRVVETVTCYNPGTERWRDLNERAPASAYALMCPDTEAAYLAQVEEEGEVVKEITSPLIDMRLGDAAALSLSVGLAGLGLLVFGGRREH